MRDVDGDARWLIRAHHWLVLAFLLSCAGTCLMI